MKTYKSGDIFIMKTWEEMLLTTKNKDMLWNEYFFKTYGGMKVVITSVSDCSYFYMFKDKNIGSETKYPDCIFKNANPVQLEFEF